MLAGWIIKLPCVFLYLSSGFNKRFLIRKGNGEEEAANISVIKKGGKEKRKKKKGKIENQYLCLFLGEKKLVCFTAIGVCKTADIR